MAPDCYILLYCSERPVRTSRTYGRQGRTSGTQTVSTQRASVRSVFWLLAAGRPQGTAPIASTAKMQLPLVFSERPCVTPILHRRNAQFVPWQRSASLGARAAGVSLPERWEERDRRQSHMAATVPRMPAENAAKRQNRHLFAAWIFPWVEDLLPMLGSGWRRCQGRPEIESDLPPKESAAPIAMPYMLKWR